MSGSGGRWQKEVEGCSPASRANRANRSRISAYRYRKLERGEMKMAKRVKKVKQPKSDFEVGPSGLVLKRDKWLDAAKLHQSLTFEQCHPKLELIGKE